MNKVALSLVLVALAAAGVYMAMSEAKLTPFEEWKQTYAPHGWTSSE